MRAPAASIDELLAALDASRGALDSLGTAGDVVDVGSHSLQCAELLSASHPGDEELIAAGLMHDLGHVIEAPPDADHGRVAAEFVVGLLGHRVATLVSLHVDAKRYLVATDPRYRAILSSGSMASLELQGGAMTDTARTRFSHDALFDDALVLRRADDTAKVPSGEQTSPNDWRELLDHVSQRHAQVNR